MAIVSLAALIAALAATFLLTGWMHRYALRAELLDVPNARSAHDAPRPRGGGVALVVVVLAGLPALTLWASLPASGLAGLWIGGAAIAAVGWLDDHGDVRPRWRLLVHLLGSAWVVVLVGGAPPLDLMGDEWAWRGLGASLLVLLLTWFVNLYNFMDGIDGIAAVEALTVGGVAAALLAWCGGTGWALTAALVSAASLGFLGWNWPPAKIFMGDAGSGFLGFVLAALMVLTSAEVGLSAWAWLILLGVFVVDATMTLVRRIVRGDRFYEAHRSHAYQHASRRYRSHRAVTLSVGAINLVWLAPLAWTAAIRPEWGIVLLFIAWAPLAALCFHFHAGLPD